MLPVASLSSGGWAEGAISCVVMKQLTCQVPTELTTDRAVLPSFSKLGPFLKTLQNVRPGLVAFSAVCGC